MSDTEAEASDKRSKERNQKLLEASDSGDHEAVRRLIEEGADTKTEKSDGNMGIHLSAVKGHVEIVSEFITRGVDVNIRSGQLKSSPLIRAAGGGHINVITLA